MRGKWNHSTKPSQYEVYDEKNKLIFSGTFNEAMNYMEIENEVIDQASYDKGYDKGFQEGANQKDNKPCVCGFWNKK
jgi:hypothetical protein